MDRRQRAILRAHRDEQRREAKARDSERQAALQRERELVQQLENAATEFRRSWKKKGYPKASVHRLYNGMSRKGQIRYKEVVGYLVAAGPTTFSMPNDNVEIRSFTSCYVLANGGWATAHHGGGSSEDLSPLESFDTWLKRLRLGQSGPLNAAARDRIRKEALERLLDPENAEPPTLPNRSNGSS